MILFGSLQFFYKLRVHFAVVDSLALVNPNRGCRPQNIFHTSKFLRLPLSPSADSFLLVYHTATNLDVLFVLATHKTLKTGLST